MTMGKSALLAVIIAIPLNLLLCLIAWPYLPERRFRAQLAAFTGSNGSDEFRLNTYEDDVCSETIGRCYEAACRRLESLRGANPRRTYSWQDSLTYPGVSSIVQFPSHYAEVYVFSGNDSDTVQVRMVPGQFPQSRQLEVRLLGSDELPKGTLRFQWER
ncbi:MAG TPA: hypothetical protein VNM14_14205 [Planctomycetota bacterium]|jgi:hypothetical protein|nr:hypothetical protein [Planctomycetota bacterium]